jgi:beta-lactamase class A
LFDQDGAHVRDIVVGNLRLGPPVWLSLAMLGLVMGFSLHAAWRLANTSAGPTDPRTDTRPLASGRAAVSPPAGQAADLLAGFRALPGQVGVLLLADGQERAALAPDQSFAVSSGFKLAVLAALAEEIAAGRRAWQDVVALQPGWKSLPSGLLQEWPDGAPLTLHTLATLMIARSDNTAADGLIHLLGRDAVERFAPRNRPLLTTREWFTLTLSEDPTWLARYRAGDETARRAVLADVRSAPLPDQSRLAHKPVVLDVEWLFTPRELCALMGRIADLPLLHVAHGPIDADRWQRVAFKGGAEPGVLSVTAELQAETGQRYCLAAVWNAAHPLDALRFAQLIADLLAHFP